MYSRSFLCEEAKIKQRTALKRERCGIGEEAIWESRFTPFLKSKHKSINNLFLHVFLFLKVILTTENYIKLLTIFI